MAADLSTLSNEDLIAYKEGRLQDVSDSGLLSIRGLTATSALDEEPQQPESNGFIDAAKGFTTGLGQGMTLGWGDEAQAGLAALGMAGAREAGLIPPEAAPYSIPEQYRRNLPIASGMKQEIYEKAPVSSFAGELGGLIASGQVGAKLGGTTLARTTRAAPKTTASAVGGISGGVYGAGVSDGDAENALLDVGVPAVLGASLGPAGAYVAPTAAKATRYLTEKAKSIFGKTKQYLDEPLEELVDAQSKAVMQPTVAPQAEDLATRKVIERIKRDYPDNWGQVLASWKSSDAPLAEVAQESITNLAKGAAQFPKGEAVAERYFSKQVAGSPERATAALPKSMENIEQIVDEGRKAAAPLYKQAEKEVVEGVVLPLEVKAAIKKAREDFPSELADLPDNSIKVLDYAKRVLDDTIGEAQRAGKGNFARSRTDIKNKLVEQMDNASPTYKQARETAGDYLSTEKAMNDGLQALKPSVKADDLVTVMKGFSESEKTAYRQGVLKSVKDTIESVADGSNPYKKVLGTPEKRKKLMRILSPTEYKNLEKTLQAEDRLFTMRNKVIGGSPTAGKQIAAQDIASGGEELITSLATSGAKGTAISALTSSVKRVFTGMNDNVAEHISRILYERDPVKKLELIDRAMGSKALTKQEKELVKTNYFKAQDYIKQRTSGAFAASTLPTAQPRDDIPTITIRPMRNE